MIAKEQERVKRLRVVMQRIQGVAYVLGILADERTEATHALRNQEGMLDEAFEELCEITETLECAHGLEESEAAKC